MSAACTPTVATGLDVLLQDSTWQKSLKGNIAYLCHSASVDRHLTLGVIPLQKIYGDRLKALFGPQHGLQTTVQDNMVETNDFLHPFFKIMTYSLYSHTRAPTPQMLQGIDTLVVDLQDVGTRVYTYIWTLTLVMEACGRQGIEVVVLDRPNPIDGLTIEGNILDPAYASFVGRFPIPMRHGLTIGEVALFMQKYMPISVSLRVIPLQNWRRQMDFMATGLPWVLPSPNLPTPEGAYTFVGTVLFEGTNISEGRGTTRSLEIIGHPQLRPFEFVQEFQQTVMQREQLQGFALRPLYFLPTFQKHQGVACGGMQIHPTDLRLFRPWRVGQWLMKELFRHLGESFAWKAPPYEYEFERMPIDFINGGPLLRQWVEKIAGPPFNTSLELQQIEMSGREDYLQKRADILLYR